MLHMHRDTNCQRSPESIQQGTAMYFPNAVTVGIDDLIEKVKLLASRNNWQGAGSLAVLRSFTGPTALLLFVEAKARSYHCRWVRRQNASGPFKPAAATPIHPHHKTTLCLLPHRIILRIGQRICLITS
jgi:hypothetical protein